MKQVDLIPIPQKVNMLEGEYVLPKNISVHLDPHFSSIEERIKEELSCYALSFSDEGEISFVYCDGYKKGGYKLMVSDKAAVYASEVSGAFYGLKSLVQLIDNGKLPRVEIIDEPRFEYRGIMLDVARHFFGKEEIKELLDVMANNKMNVFHWHLTEDQGWRIEIKKYPQLAPKACVRNNDWTNHLGHMTGQKYGEGLYFTQEDIKEIVSYAAERMIMVVPEIDMPGHITSALSVFPELSCEGKPLEVATKYGVKNTIGCVGNPDFLRFTKDIVDEICELFPAPYFHIGGDEVPKDKWKECPKCQKLMKEKGIKSENDLQGWFTNEMMNYLAQKGKMTIGWNEIMENDQLRKDAVVQWWMGKYAAKWAKNGGKMILSQCTTCYLDYPYILTNLEKIYDLGPERSKMSEDAKKNVLGIEAPLWTEFVYDKKKFDFMLYPRVQAVAEAAWSDPSRKNYSDFEKRLKKYLRWLDSKGIGYCPPSKYNPVGIRGFKQRFLVGRKMLKNPNIEVEF